MSEYEWKMLQVPPTIAVKERSHRGNEAAAYLEEIVGSMAINGWEFFRVDAIGVQVQPGCLASLFGGKVSETVYYVISFRRLA